MVSHSIIFKEKATKVCQGIRDLTFIAQGTVSKAEWGPTNGGTRGSMQKNCALHKCGRSA